MEPKKPHASRFTVMEGEKDQPIVPERNQTVAPEEKKRKGCDSNGDGKSKISKSEEDSLNKLSKPVPPFFRSKEVNLVPEIPLVTIQDAINGFESLKAENEILKRDNEKMQHDLSVLDAGSKKLSEELQEKEKEMERMRGEIELKEKSAKENLDAVDKKSQQTIHSFVSQMLNIYQGLASALSRSMIPASGHINTPAVVNPPGEFHTQFNLTLSGTFIGGSHQQTMSSLQETMSFLQSTVNFLQPIEVPIQLVQHLSTRIPCFVNNYRIHFIQC